jgi:hypothetical protein
MNMGPRPFLFGCILALTFWACGEGDGGLSIPLVVEGGGWYTDPIPEGDNVLPLVVNAGVPVTTDKGTQAIGYTNGLFASVTICVPGTSECQTIDHVLVDTGSVGLRVLESAMELQLPEHTDENGAALATCAQFVDGAAWGPLRVADVVLGNERLPSFPIQAIGTSVYPLAQDCTGKSISEIKTLGSNGILGVGLSREDCGFSCTRPASSVFNPGIYFACSGTTKTCSITGLPLAKQLLNPVVRMSQDNNGVFIQLPQIAATGAVSVAGALAFGIGTRENNGLGNATVITTDAIGFFDIQFPVGGPNYLGFIDSGSNGNFFLNPGTSKIPTCTSDFSDFYCPNSHTSLGVALAGLNGNALNVHIGVANAVTLFRKTSNWAFSNLGGPMPGFPEDSSLPAFDLGLAFHFGRRIFSAIEGEMTPAGVGPYFAL